MLIVLTIFTSFGVLYNRERLVAAMNLEGSVTNGPIVRKLSECVCGGRKEDRTYIDNGRSSRQILRSSMVFGADSTLPWQRIQGKVELFLELKEAEATV